MLRPLRGTDVPEYGQLYRKYFPEEPKVLLTDAVAFERVVARAFHWDARLILGLLRLVRRPLGDFFALEADGRLAGVAFLFYDGGLGYIGSVAVDAPYRRRGYARQLMLAAEAAAAKHGCPYTILDVIETNQPAIQLYLALDYHRIRRVGWYYRDLGGANPPLPNLPPGERGRRIRSYRKSDGVALAALAQARQPALERAVRPTRPGAFSVPPLLTRALGGETAAFVSEGPQGVEGFVRSTTSPTMASGNLVPPVVAATASEEVAMDLLDRGMAWFEGRAVRRIVCEVPEDDRTTLNRLAARGFQRGLGLETLAKSL